MASPASRDSAEMRMRGLSHMQTEERGVEEKVDRMKTQIAYLEKTLAATSTSSTPPTDHKDLRKESDDSVGGSDNAAEGDSVRSSDGSTSESITGESAEG